MNPLSVPLLFGLLTLAAEDPGPKDPVMRDLNAGVRARQAINQDQELGPLNLGVNVQGGVATLWGPVTSGEQKDRAMRMVRGVPGVREVRSELYVDANQPVDWLGITDLLRGREETLSASPDPLLGKLPPLVSRGKAPEEPPPAKTGGVAVSLGSPLPLGDGRAANKTETAKAREPDGSLKERVEKVQASDPRFRGVRVEIVDTTVTLRGSVKPGQNVMAFAQALSHVPGIERVVVRTEPPR